MTREKASAWLGKVQQGAEVCVASRNVSLSVNLTQDSASCLQEGVKPPSWK